MVATNCFGTIAFRTLMFNLFFTDCFGVLVAKRMFNSSPLQMLIFWEKVEGGELLAKL